MCSAAQGLHVPDNAASCSRYPKHSVRLQTGHARQRYQYGMFEHLVMDDITSCIPACARSEGRSDRESKVLESSQAER